jgi:glycosyltransferase involved in cell wall biosynthesis
MIRSIISTGHGRLHLVTSAVAIQEAGVDVRLIQGWVPRYTPSWLINGVGRLVGSKNLAWGMNKRRPPELRRDQLHSCAFSEFATQAMFLARRAGLMDHTTAAVRGWRMYGKACRKYIRDADIFHPRAAAGRGGAIETAKARGMKVVVDHSIAHPAIIERNLADVHKRHNLELWIKPDDLFWQNVLKDCEEADCLLVNSQYVKDTFVECGYPAEKIAVIYLGIRTDFQALKTDWSRTGPLRMLFTGGFGLRKGANILMEAVGLLRDAGLDYQLDVVGNVDAALPIPDHIKRDERVKLHGHVPQDDLRGFLRESDVYVFASYAEGAAQSAAEAMAAGLPVVVTAETGVPVKHEQNGLVIERDSADSLAKAVLRLADDEDMRRALGQAATETIRANHTWEAYGRHVRGLYESLLAGASPAGGAENSGAAGQ